MSGAFPYPLAETNEKGHFDILLQWLLKHLAFISTGELIWTEIIKVGQVFPQLINWTKMLYDIPLPASRYMSDSLCTAIGL